MKFNFKSKLLNSLLILTSLVGYLQWGKDNDSFLFEVEAEIFSKLFTDPASVIHPLTILPMSGQILLLITLFQKQPGKILSLIGMSCIGLLIGLMFFIGIIDLNWRILLSTVPFLLIGFLTVRHHKRKTRTTSQPISEAKETREN